MLTIFIKLKTFLFLSMNHAMKTIYLIKHHDIKRDEVVMI